MKTQYSCDGNRTIANELRTEVKRGGTVDLGSILVLANYAIDQGVPEERVQQLIGSPLDASIADRTIDALAGPNLLARLLDEGSGASPTIDIARYAPFSLFRGLERAVLLAPTGREALKSLCANFAAFHSGLKPAFEETRSYTRFSFRFEGVEFDNGCSNEIVLAVLVRLMRSVFGSLGQPKEVQLRFGRNGTKSAYDRFFASSIKVHSEDQSFGAVWRKEDMRWQQPGYDSKAFDLVVRELSEAASLRQQKTEKSPFDRLISASNLCVKVGRGVGKALGFGDRPARRAPLGGRDHERARRSGLARG
ncbi:MAG: AraC family transcriptional regulator ligand-binding domain-containing protein, partial [Pseudomonadota bacterium]